MRNPLASCVQLAGSAAGGVLLFRLRFLQRVATISFDDGLCFVAKSVLRWQVETGLSEKQVRWAIKDLERRGLVEDQVRNFRGSRTHHLRTTDQVAFALQGTPICPPGQMHLPSRAAAMYRGDIIGDKRGVDCAPLRERAISGSEKIEEEVSGGEEVPTVEDVVMGKVSRKPVRKNARATPAEIWRANQAGACQGFVPALTQQSAGQLRMIEKQLPCEIDFTRLAGVLFERWAEFVSQVKTSAGLKDVPSEPHVGFVLKHVGVAVNFVLASALNHGKKAAGFHLKEAVADKGPKQPEPEAASAAEALAILRGDPE